MTNDNANIDIENSSINNDIEDHNLVKPYNEVHKEYQNALNRIKELNTENATRRHREKELLSEMDKLKVSLKELENKCITFEKHNLKLKRDDNISKIASKLGFRSINDALLNTDETIEDIESHLEAVLLKNPHYRATKKPIGSSFNPINSGNSNVSKPHDIINKLLRY